MGVIFVKSSRSQACLANWIASCLWRFPSVEINLFLLFALCLFPITDSFSKLSGEMYVCIFWLVNGILDWTGCNLIPMFLQIRMWQRDSRDRTVLQATPAAAIDVSEHFFSVFFLFLQNHVSCVSLIRVWILCFFVCVNSDLAVILADVTYSCLYW